MATITYNDDNKIKYLSYTNEDKTDSSGNVTKTRYWFRDGDAQNKIGALVDPGTDSNGNQITNTVLLKSGSQIKFKDPGLANATTTSASALGSIYWSGKTDWVKIFAECPTTSDQCYLVIQLGDDNSNKTSFRNASGAEVGYITASGAASFASLNSAGTISGKKSITLLGDESTENYTGLIMNASDKTLRASIGFLGNCEGTGTTTRLQLATSYGDIYLAPATKNVRVAGELTISGDSSTTAAATKTKITFIPEDANQTGYLWYSDYDSYQAPASLTFGGSQGGEYFIAPNIKATTSVITNEISSNSFLHLDYNGDKSFYITQDNKNTVFRIDDTGYTHFTISETTSSGDIPILVSSDVGSSDGTIRACSLTTINGRTGELKGTKITTTGDIVSGGAFKGNLLSTNDISYSINDSSSGPKKNTLGLIKSDGVMEIGQYLDFHNNSEASTDDYSTRILADGIYKNIITLPTTSGRIALTSNLPKVIR